MSGFVVDASVAMKWCLPEEHSDAAWTLLSQSDPLHVPDFFYLEVDSALCKWVRRRQLTQVDAADARAAIRRVLLHVHPTGQLSDGAWQIASELRCTYYDGLYLALAARVDGVLVTGDRRLHRGISRGPFADRIAWIGDVG
jgi:predicted nucleic acid-binding protein